MIKKVSPDNQAHPSVEANMASPAYKLAALDADFLLGDSMRGARFLLEYQKAEEHLRAWGVRSTLVVFGSARFRPDGPERHANWYNAARKFGELAAKHGGSLFTEGKMRDNVIATGGGPGIMEAANRGAHDVGAPSVGFNITLPFEQEPNAYSTPDLTFNFHYFNMRKLHLAMRANGLAVFPGGFGTMDELFELLTLRQTLKIDQPVPIVLYDEEFWKSFLNMETLIEAGTISPDDLNLFSYANSPEEAWETLVARGVLDICEK